MRTVISSLMVPWRLHLRQPSKEEEDVTGWQQQRQQQRQQQQQQEVTVRGGLTGGAMRMLPRGSNGDGRR